MKAGANRHDGGERRPPTWMWAKADPSAGVMSEGTGAAGEKCRGKARVHRGRLGPL